MAPTTERAGIGDVIRTERLRLGMSQRDLAKRLGKSPGAIGQWENGSTRPTLAHFIEACGVFGISVRGFIGPDSPYRGELVEDADELALIETWRNLSPAARPVVLQMLRNARPVVVEGDEPKPPRKQKDAG
jgi:transcriptional regulator with XRE-family HTH domain